MAYQQFADFSTNSTNPFYLHPNENPAPILVSPLLDDKNYHNWARSMHIALISKNKDKFVDGYLAKPLGSISESITKSVLWIDSAAGVWKNLQLRFSHSDIFRVSDLQEEIYRLRQGNLDVSNYFTQLKVLWDELDNYRPLITCACAIPCSCGVVISSQQYRAQDQVIRFLKGLNEKFTHSKSQIMMMSPLPSLDKAFSLIIQQERELNHSSSTQVQASANPEELTTACQAQACYGSSNAKHGNYTKGRGSTRVCTHCGRSNHTVETCFLKHGYPPGFKNKSKNQSTPTKNQSNATANAVSEASQQDSTTPLCNFTQEQYHSLVELLQQSKLNPQANSVSTSPLAMNTLSSNTIGMSSHLWILDTGAT
ncbi:uncharacterized protein LOC131659708 [Vicia villosa]|uniref:uncharacterized protein LOC131659708 n=1 Tax=Vicia villosa TaxID=3911 RepID=UPI00273CD9CD|nr:uncharacterized protein LOC131659708 [Vicia villosa]